MDESSPLPGGGTLTALSSRCKAGVRRDRSNLGTRARQNADSTAMYSMSWRAALLDPRSRHRSSQVAGMFPKLDLMR